MGEALDLLQKTNTLLASLGEHVCWSGSWCIYLWSIPTTRQTQRLARICVNWALDYDHPRYVTSGEIFKNKVSSDQRSGFESWREYNHDEDYFINHTERSSVPKRSQESYRQGRDDSGCKSTMRDSGRKSAMFAVLTHYNCKKPGHRMKIANTWLKSRRQSQKDSKIGKKNVHVPSQ